jgi:hypothetical protein
MNNTKLIAALIFLSLFTIQAVSAMQKKKSATQRLQDFVWENRVLIISPKSQMSANALTKQFQTHARQMWERKLIALLLVDETVIELRFTQQGMAAATASSNSSSNNMEMQYSEPELRKRLSGKQSILIGLDGGTKSVYNLNNEQLDIQQLFADIDSMPMRRGR